jgi:hypothetical protein
MNDVQVSKEMLDLAVAAYNAEPGEREGMRAALTAVDLYTPQNLKVSMRTFRPRIFGVRDSMCTALTAVLENSR